MGKKTPLISIIVISNNKIDKLKRCLWSIRKIDNAEILIINNYESKIKSSEINSFLEETNDSRIIYYQSNILLSKNALRNIALSFATGNWLHFIEEEDILRNHYINFLIKTKLNPQMHFYRLQLIENKRNRKKFKFFQNNKYYLLNLNSFLLNGEWIRDTRIQFNDNLEFDDSLLFINLIYNFKNVNFSIVKRFYAIKTNSQVPINYENYSNSELVNKINDTIDSFLIHKKRNYKQFIILMLYQIYKDKIYKKNIEEKRFWINEITKITIKSKIWFGNYWNLNIFFAIKTIAMRFMINCNKFQTKINKKQNVVEETSNHLTNNE